MIRYTIEETKEEDDPPLLPDGSTPEECCSCPQCNDRSTDLPAIGGAVWALGIWAVLIALGLIYYQSAR